MERISLSTMPKPLFENNQDASAIRKKDFIWQEQTKADRPPGLVLHGVSLALLFLGMLKKIQGMSTCQRSTHGFDSQFPFRDALLKVSMLFLVKRSFGKFSSTTLALMTTIFKKQISSKGWSPRPDYEDGTLKLEWLDKRKKASTIFDKL